MMIFSYPVLTLTLVLTVLGNPVDKRASFTKSNGEKAKALNAKFKTLNANSKCTSGENACVKGKFAQCVNGKFVLTPCGPSLECIALPLVNSAGTSITCDTAADAAQRIKNTGAKRETEDDDDEDFDLFKRATSPPACKNKNKRSNLEYDPEEHEHSRRIAQTDLGTLAESWQKLCLASGGDTQTNDPCVQLAGIRGINSILANGKPCDQQDVADDMITFAKSKGIKNKDALIKNAIAYRKHPRNALNIGGVVPSTVFCNKAPKNPELKGVVNAQLKGVDPGLFGAPNIPIFAFGGEGSCPFGKKADVAKCSCD